MAVLLLYLFFLYLVLRCRTFSSTRKLLFAGNFPALLFAGKFPTVSILNMHFCRTCFLHYIFSYTFVGHVSYILIFSYTFVGHIFPAFFLFLCICIHFLLFLYTLVRHMFPTHAGNMFPTHARNMFPTHAGHMFPTHEPVNPEMSVSLQKKLLISFGGCLV